jgi:aspartate aminotransferase-like enzyme
VTAAWLPEGVDWNALDAAMLGRDLVVAGGQGKWAGRIIRFGHMGDVTWDEIDAALAVTAEALSELGHAADGAAARQAGRAAFEAAARAGVAA